MKIKQTVLTVLIVCLGFSLPLNVYGGQGTHEEDRAQSKDNDAFWEDDVKQYESVHDHTNYEGGQVGMAGSLHIEFVSKEKGEYRIYVTGYERDSIDISKATGFLIIDPESSDPEKLVLSVDKILQEFLVAKGKERKQGDMITASMEVKIPEHEKIIQSFYIKINPSSSGHKLEHGKTKDDHDH